MSRSVETRLETGAEKLALVEETVAVSAATELTGRVRIETVTELVDETVSASLERQDVHVVRVPVGRFVTEMPTTRTENGVTIVPIVEEVLVVEKRLRLKEELHIHTVTSQEVTEVPVTLRKQQAVVERLGAGPTNKDLTHGS